MIVPKSHQSCFMNMDTYLGYLLNYFTDWQNAALSWNLTEIPAKDNGELIVSRFQSHSKAIKSQSDVTRSDHNINTFRSSVQIFLAKVIWVVTIQSLEPVFNLLICQSQTCVHGWNQLYQLGFHRDRDFFFHFSCLDLKWLFGILFFKKKQLITDSITAVQKHSGYFQTLY